MDIDFNPELVQAITNLPNTVEAEIAALADKLVANAFELLDQTPAGPHIRKCPACASRISAIYASGTMTRIADAIIMRVLPKETRADEATATDALTALLEKLEQGHDRR